MRSSTLRHPALLAGASLLRLQSDERLAELAIAGHEAAFDAIVVRYRAPIQRYCAGIVGPSRAEDAEQQTLINAHDALKRTDEVRHLRSWLYRIAHNVSLNVLRAVRDDLPLDEPSTAYAAVGTDDGPSAAFERSERFRATVEALRELPERQRAALVLRELEGRSHEEIAEALGVTKGAARQHLMRARTAVRGAVTAITPYPLIARLAHMLSGPGSAGWADAATGVGATATLAKLTAGVVATGALVGGAVGTERVIGHRDGGPPGAGVVDAAPPAAAKVALKTGARVVTPGLAGTGGGATAGARSGGGSGQTAGRPKPGGRSAHGGAPGAKPATPGSAPTKGASAGRGRSDAPGQARRGASSSSTAHRDGAASKATGGARKPSTRHHAKRKAHATKPAASAKAKHQTASGIADAEPTDATSHSHGSARTGTADATGTTQTTATATTETTSSTSAGDATTTTTTTTTTADGG